MKSSGVRFAWLIPLAASVSAFNPHLFFINTDAHDASSINQPEPVTVSASSARLILASKLGVSRYHSVGNTDEDTLGLLSEYLGKSLPFRQDGSRTNPTAVLFIDGAEDIPDVISNEVRQGSTQVVLDSTTGYHANRILLTDFATQREEISSLVESNHGAHLFQSEAEDVLDVKPSTSYKALEWADINGKARVMIAHSTLPDSTNRNKGTASAKCQDAKQQVQTLVQRLLEKATRHSWNVVIAVMPLLPTEHNVQRRTADPWGMYDLLLSPRQEESSANESNIVGLRQIASQEGDISPMQNNYPSGILRECYSSRDDCVKTTRNCSGHGSCNLKYSYKVEDSSVQCFACACQPETRANGDGSKKITYWAGPACQKVDVSTSFWLLGGITFGLVIIIAWAIGLLYSMGQQELPSVIGAGVTGPRAR